MELPLRNTSGEVTGSIEVSDAVFDQPMNQAWVHQAVVMYQSNRRSGTHTTSCSPPPSLSSMYIAACGEMFSCRRAS